MKNGILSTTVLAVAMLTAPAMAANSGGSWFDGSPLRLCASGATGDTYAGTCSTTGDASNRDVVFDSGTADAVIGGYTSNIGSDANNNKVTIQGGDAGDVIGGHGYAYGASSSSDAVGNHVVMSGGKASKLRGGQATGKAKHNSVEISAGQVSGNIVGGASEFGTASENTVTVSGGDISGRIYGGDSDQGDATGNVVTVSNGSMLGVSGGRSSNKNANGNEVHVTGGDIQTTLAGGYTGPGGGAANGNTVTVSGGTIGTTVTGGSSFSDDARDNKVTISGGDITKNVYGASGGKNITDNSVTVSGGTMRRYVYGGHSFGGDVTGNKAIILGGDIKQRVYGGSSQAGKATDNTVTISDGTIGSTVFGGYSEDGVASGNTVTISGGSVDRWVYGGYSNNNDATGNAVTVSGGSITRAVNGGYSSDGDATGNTATVSGGTIIGGVNGGYSYRGDASNNTVAISGGTIDGNIYGGRARTASGGLTTHNRVILSGAPILSSNRIIGGGTNPADITGNVLEVHTKGLTAYNIENFEQYHFLLPAGTQNGNTVLILTDTAGTDISSTQVGVAIQSGNNVLKKGDKVTLVHNSSGLNTAGVSQTELTGYQGIALEYDFALKDDANNLYAVTQQVKVRDQSKAPVEGRVAAMAFSLQGADLVAGAGLADVVAAGNGAFGVLAGGDSRYNTGSHVDVDGLNAMVGVKKHWAVSSGNLAVGGFFEAGRGNYDTYNHFKSGRVHGSGDSKYYGVGLLAQHSWASGLYAEGSLRGGRIESDWSSNDMGVADASYDVSSAYYGAHLGLGYVIDVGEHTSVDVSAKYFWAHQGSEDTDVAGDPYHFDSIDSHRTRVGARVSHSFNERITGYTGAAWEHEYDGTARATAYGKDTGSPSLEGDTGVFDLGMNIRPGVDSTLSVDVGLQGYLGQREGLGAALDVNWAF